MIKAHYANVAMNSSQELFKPITSDVTWTPSETYSENVVSLKWWPLIDHHPGSSLVMPNDTV
jgi:hypothetical protein